MEDVIFLSGVLKVIHVEKEGKAKESHRGHTEFDVFAEYPRGCAEVEFKCKVRECRCESHQPQGGHYRKGLPKPMQGVLQSEERMNQGQNPPKKCQPIRPGGEPGQVEELEKPHQRIS
ncbi:hypothetical protein GW7_12219 [Heterocephalus glaber]|uniref:Uncharacterized protein n=1 Tax=Heterocephalus glaber TaxID=10181 RepID=G5AQ04_HETGA|nr:hypothetical protein GW7_12219 [Heterocephalus glaber]